MSVGDLVEYRHKQRKALGTVVGVFTVDDVQFARVQLDKSLFGYSPPELVVSDTKNLRLVAKAQEVHT